MARTTILQNKPPSSTFHMLASSARTPFLDDLECGRPGGSSALVARAQAATASAAHSAWDAMPDRHKVAAATFRVGAWVWGSVAYLLRSAATVATTAAGAARPRIAEVWAITTSGRAEAVGVEVQPGAAAWRSKDARYPPRAHGLCIKALSPSRSRSLSQCRDDETARRGMRPFYIGHVSDLDRPVHGPIHGVLHGDKQTEGKSHGRPSSSAYMASLLPVPPSSSPASRPSSSPPIPVVVALPFSNPHHGSDPLFDPRIFDPRFPTAVPVVTPVAVPVSLEATMEVALGAMEVQVAVPI